MRIRTQKKNYLQKPDEFACDKTGLPGDGDLPDDVGQHADEAHAEVGRRQVFDEKIHSRLSTLGSD